ncbi:hypothetical protein ASD56_01395 [Microbacterium sp. Root166]|jgi:hypothetical protein|uniref:hypothetical protein n=1 Tax=Microbacterium sp. Root166 TaxID=1736478 RepID=UPI000701B2A6|nr:hypothetical protein [Microbacterium sp. Root166]KQZ85055.1 hypothetical protein ASD56_01395 [Microbacterium sp. Root166]
MDRELPDGVINADPPGGWDQTGDAEAAERSAAAADSELLTDAALQPDDPVEGEDARQGADPDLGLSTTRGDEEP